MNFKILALTLFISAGVALGDINKAKNEAIQKIKSSVSCVQNLGSEITNTFLPQKKQVVPKVFQHTNDFGNIILSNFNKEIEMDSKTNFIKADLKSSSTNVYACIGLEANTGKSNLKSNYDSFYEAAVAESRSADTNFDNAVKAWKSEMDKAIPIYTNVYNQAVYGISQASNEVELNKIVKNFTDATAKIETSVRKIIIDINTLLINYTGKMQVLTTNLAASMAVTKKSAYDKMNNCFTAKKMFLTKYLHYARN